MYDMPDEIDVRAEGPLRIITLNRPDALNAVNDALHCGLAKLWTQLDEDHDARAAVLTGSGRAFSAGVTSTTSTRSGVTRSCAPRRLRTAARSCWAWRGCAPRSSPR